MVDTLIPLPRSASPATTDWGDARLVNRITGRLLVRANSIAFSAQASASGGNVWSNGELIGPRRQCASSTQSTTSLNKGLSLVISNCIRGVIGAGTIMSIYPPKKHFKRSFVGLRTFSSHVTFAVDDGGRMSLMELLLCKSAC